GQVLVVRLEVALLVPPVVEIPLHGLGVIGFGQLRRLCVRRIHPESLFRESLLVGVRYKKAALTLPGRVSPRYHLASVRTAPLSNALTGVPATRYIRDTDLTGGPHGRRSVLLALPRLPVPGRRLPGGMHTYSSRSSEVRQVYAMTQAPLDQRCEAHCTSAPRSAHLLGGFRLGVRGGDVQLGFRLPQDLPVDFELVEDVRDDLLLRIAKDVVPATSVEEPSHGAPGLPVLRVFGAE